MGNAKLLIICFVMLLSSCSKGSLQTSGEVPSGQVTHDFIGWNVFAFNHSDAFKRILEDDRTKVKMIQKIDDYVARVFFAHKALIVEGDTEDIVFRKTISLMPENRCCWQRVRCCSAL